MRMKTIPCLPMRAILLILLSHLAITAHAKEWKNELYHCAASIPDGNGWQMIDAPPMPGIAPVLVMQNTSRQSVFGINVVEKYRDANLADPAIQRELETLLRQFGYEFIGHANVNVAGINWLQYPVRSNSGPQQISGLIRYASVGGYVFCISLLRGGGQQAAQDSELLQAAASFRISPAGTIAAKIAPTTAQPLGTSGKVPLASAQKRGAEAEPPATNEEAPASEDNSKARMIWAGAAGLVVLVFFLGIIGRKPSR